MNTLKDRNHFNSYCALGHKFYTKTLKSVESRRTRLESLLAKRALEREIRHAGKFAGRRPSLHIETGLVRRITKARLGKYIQQFKIPISEFDITLKKAEKLMTSNPKFSGDKRKLIEASYRVFKACKFPDTKFVPTSYQYASENQVNPRSSSGFPFYRRKGQVMTKLLSQADSLTADSHMWDWPMTRGFRLQLRKAQPKLKLKIRVMYPYPGVFILLEDTFIIPFVKHFIENDTFYVIGRNGKQISELLKKKFHKSNRILTSDVEAFDQNMLNETVIMAFYVLRAQLKLTKHQAELFEKMVEYFCTSLMVSKSKGSPVYGFIKTHGIPSGSGFTNMIGTIAHAIVLEYLQPHILDQCLICGDDNIVSADTMNVEELFSGYTSVFNLPISQEKSETFSSSKDVSFLGFRWKNYTRLVDRALVLNQLIWHTDFLTELDLYQRELARGASVLLNGANGSELFRMIFPDVMKMLDEGRDVRFTYLFGYQPPTTIPGVLSYSKIRGPEPNTNQSLKLHLNKGWLIR